MPEYDPWDDPTQNIPGPKPMKCDRCLRRHTDLKMVSSRPDLLGICPHCVNELGLEGDVVE